jgi:hypothetical protein
VKKMAVLGEIGRGTTPRFILKTVCSTGDIVAFELTIKSGAEKIEKKLSDMTKYESDEHLMTVDLTQADTLKLSDEITYQYHYRLAAEDGGTGGFTNSSRIYRRTVRELLSGRDTAL